MRYILDRKRSTRDVDANNERRAKSHTADRRQLGTPAGRVRPLSRPHRPANHATRLPAHDQAEDRLPGGSYTFLSCSYKSTDYLISISSGNITFAEEKKKEAGNPSAQATTVDEHPALMIADRSDYGGGCTLAMQTSYGIVILTRETAALGTKMSAPPCEGIEDTARQISQFMPAGS